MERRTFLQAATAGAVGTILGSRTVVSAGEDKPIRIEEPFHGAVFNRRQGEEVPGGLKIRVRGKAPPGGRVTVNGAESRREGTEFAAETVLREKENMIVAAWQHQDTRREDLVRVLWDRHSRPRYRFAIDDNSFFLRDIARKVYTSLFDCFYLDMLRRLHRKYGARFVLNIYYATADGFELPQFPDRYKSQWRDNSDWLKLAFHAHADKPDRPYQDAPPEKLLADFDEVAEQIHRFAGPETYSPPTVIHWGMVRPTALKPLFQRGVRVLSGYFEQRNGAWDINYRLDDARSEYLSRHDELKHFESGLVFSRIDMVCNLTPLQRIVPALESVANDPNRAEIMDLFTHEQYFWPFYHNYLADHADRLDAAIRWVTEYGYKPVFFHEGFLGGPALGAFSGRRNSETRNSLAKWS